MKTKLFLVVVLVFRSTLLLGASCEGKGTVFYFGNGMFNSLEDAEKSQKRLFKLIEQNIPLDASKDATGDLAYKLSEESDLIQIFNVVNQKGIDRWEDFWLWLSSLKTPQDWFKEAVKLKAAEALKSGTIAFDDLRQHFEDYSRYIRNGYNVILISHSQGNFFANQAMRKLADYTDASLTGSLSSKEREISRFPIFFDLFANVQVATPVSATINSSPWSTFRDDLIMDLARRTPLGVLPANVKTPGSNIPPDGDWKGHDFIKAYLRNEESRRKILSDIQTQYNKLKFPIGYFDKAILFESHWRHFGEGEGLHSPDAHLSFDIVSTFNRDIGSHAEDRPHKNEIIDQAFAYCKDLPLGLSKIFLRVDSEENREVSFEVWPEGKKEKDKKPTIITFHVKKGGSEWEVGIIRTEIGSGKEPLKVAVEIYPQPKTRLRASER